MGPDRARSRSAGEAPPAAEIPRRRGRPRRAAVEEAVLRATMDLLREVGAQGTTISAIAARSRCSRTTIYRRWPSRDSIILDALRLAARGTPEDLEEAVALERELGSTIRAAARRGVAVYGSPIMRAVLPLIARELLASSPIGERYLTDVFGPIRDAAKARLGDAVARGEVAPDVDGDLLYDLVFGALMYRLLVGEPLDATVADALAELLIRGAAGPAVRKGPPVP